MIIPTFIHSRAIIESIKVIFVLLRTDSFLDEMIVMLIKSNKYLAPTCKYFFSIGSLPSTNLESHHLCEGLTNFHVVQGLSLTLYWWASTMLSEPSNIVFILVFHRIFLPQITT